MLIFYFVLGCIVGSFFCLTARRLPLRQSILFPRSHCMYCQQTLAWTELIPVLSILLQKSKCKHCHYTLSKSYLLAEISSGLLFVYFFHIRKDPDLLTFIWIFSAFLLSLSDCFYYQVESNILFSSWVLLWSGWLLSQTFHWQTVILMSVSTIFLLKYAHSYFGDGDTLLLLCWSAGIPVTDLFRLLFFASIAGLTVFALYALLQRRPLEKLPFVPFLSLGLLAVL